MNAGVGYLTIDRHRHGTPHGFGADTAAAEVVLTVSTTVTFGAVKSSFTRRDFVRRKT